LSYGCDGRPVVKGRKSIVIKNIVAKEDIRV
jgi:hypothetical protein